MIEEQQRYAYWLSQIPTIGDKTIAKLLRHFLFPQNIYEAAAKELEEVLSKRQVEYILNNKKEIDLTKRLMDLEKQGIYAVFKGEAAYPKRLLSIPDPPYCLFYKGHLPDEKALSVAIVGARDCSMYGAYVAKQLGYYLGERGVLVISGMARGIDGISQQGALMGNGSSYGVLGCGVDICYPKSNQEVYQKLMERGGILSCYQPGTPPTAQNFPPRNRIVSGLSDVLVVIEARKKSGTLITVDMALEQGKEVYVVPGRITDRLSDGCNALLKQGAGIFLSPAEFYDEISKLEIGRSEIGEQEIFRSKISKTEIFRSEISKQEFREKADNMTASKVKDELQALYDILDFSPKSTKQIIAELGESCEERSVNTKLMQLCMEGLGIQVSPGQFCRRSSDLADI